MSQALKVENCDKGRGCRCIPPQGEEEAWATKAESYVNSLVRLEIADDRYAWALLRKAQLLWYVHKRNYVDTGDYTFFWLAEDTMQEAIEAYGCYAGEDTQQWSLDMMYVARDLRLFAYENKKAEEAKNEIMEEVEGGDPMDVDNE